MRAALDRIFPLLAAVLCVAGCAGASTPAPTATTKPAPPAEPRPPVSPGTASVGADLGDASWVRTDTTDGARLSLGSGWLRGRQIEALEFSADGRLLIAADYQGEQIAIWDLVDGTERRISVGPADFAQNLRRLRGSGKMIVGLFREVRELDLDTATLADTGRELGQSQDMRLASTPDDRFLIAAAHDFCVLDLEHPALAQHCSPDDHPTSTSYVATLDTRPDLVVRCESTLAAVHRLTGEPGGATELVHTLELEDVEGCVAVPGTGDLLVADRSSLTTWRFPADPARVAPTTLATTATHGTTVYDLVASDDGRYLAHASDDALTVYELPALTELWSMEYRGRRHATRNRICSRNTVFSPDGKLLATRCDENTDNQSAVVVFDSATGRELASGFAPSPEAARTSGWAESVTISADASHIAVTPGYGHPWWRVADGQAIEMPAALPEAPESVVLGPSGALSYASQRDGIHRVIGDTVTLVDAVGNDPDQVAVDVDGAAIFVEDGRLWRIEPGESPAVDDVSPEVDRVLAAFDGTSWTWVQTATPREGRRPDYDQILIDRTDATRTLVPSAICHTWTLAPERLTVAVTGVERDTFVQATSCGLFVYRLDGDLDAAVATRLIDGAVFGVVASPDGSTFVSAAPLDGQTVLALHDGSTGEVLARRTIERARVFDLDVADDTTVVTLSDAARVDVWPPFERDEDGVTSEGAPGR